MRPRKGPHLRLIAKKSSKIEGPAKKCDLTAQMTSEAQN